MSGGKLISGLDTFNDSIVRDDQIEIQRTVTTSKTNKTTVGKLFETFGGTGAINFGTGSNISCKYTWFKVKSSTTSEETQVTVHVKVPSSVTDGTYSSTNNIPLGYRPTIIVRNILEVSPSNIVTISVNSTGVVSIIKTVGTQVSFPDTIISVTYLTNF
jgi:hypothetical protein